MWCLPPLPKQERESADTHADLRTGPQPSKENSFFPPSQKNGRLICKLHRKMPMQKIWVTAKSRGTPADSLVSTKSGQKWVHSILKEKKNVRLICKLHTKSAIDKAQSAPRHKNVQDYTCHADIIPGTVTTRAASKSKSRGRVREGKPSQGDGLLKQKDAL